MQWDYTSSEVLADGLKLATGKQLYEGMYKKWKALNVTSLEETNVVKKATCDGFGANTQYDTFEQDYAKALEKAGNGNDKAYSKSVKISKIKASKVDFRLNNQDYTLYFMGDNGVVMYDELPKTLVMYKPSFFQGLKLKLTRKKRHISFIKTAAYIFQCDGKTIDESHVLNVFLNGLDMKYEKKVALKEKLATYNSSMPYETFRKEVKSIFASKKALTFAWQCMAVDKQTSEQEKELFDKMVAEYKNIDSAEVENIKRFAAKYSLLKDEYLVHEYLG